MQTKLSYWMRYGALNLHATFNEMNTYVTKIEIERFSRVRRNCSFIANTYVQNKFNSKYLFRHTRNKATKVY